MAVESLDFWEKEWPVIAAAPHLAIGGIIVTILIVGSATWFFVNWNYRQRLKLADDRVRFTNEIRDDIARQFKDFKKEVAAGAGIDAVIARIAKLEALLNALTWVLNATEGADIANFHGTVGKSNWWSRFCLARKIKK